MIVPDDRAAIVNCDLDFGVGVAQVEGGRRARIYVKRDVVEPEYDGPALRAFMEDLAVCWLRQVAPHRLALGTDEEAKEPSA